MISENFYLILWSEEIIFIGYNLVRFLQNFMENIPVLTKCIVISYLVMNN